jgi:hypothetical protein
MISLVTENFKIELAKQVYNLMDLNFNNSLPATRQSFLYAVLGRSVDWPDPNNPPAPTEATNCLNQLFRDAVYAKRLTNAESSFVVRRINWQSGIVYDGYSDAQCNFTFDLDFYVMNSSFQVFKCLDNNGGIASTSEPSITLSSTSLEEPFVQTADGYKWKYLYTLSSIQRQKYLTQDWMPVSLNKFVSSSAINGSIDLVKILNSGNNYTDGATQDIITIEGDGAGAALRANVVDGKIVEVVIQDRGRDYTYAEITIDDVEGGIGTGASLQAIIAPQDGHGFDPVYELGASTLMFDCDFDGTDTTFISENDFRQVFIVKNPTDNNTGLLANLEKYTLYHRVTTSPGVGNFNEDEVVFQGTTFDTAFFTANVVYFDQTQNILYLNNLKGNLSLNQSIKGVSTGSIRIANSIQNPTMKPFTGKVLYISNTEPVSRNIDQTDRIRFILKFESNEA